MACVRDDADTLFKLAKAMSQASTTAPYEVQSNLEALLDTGIEVPAQFVCTTVRFIIVDILKFSKFSQFEEMSRADGAWVERMLKGGMTRDWVDEFFFGQFVDVATKAMKAVTVFTLFQDDSRWCCCIVRFPAKAV